MTDALLIYSEEDVIEFFMFLDTLRVSGEINMVAAAPCLVEAFGISREKSIVVHSLWVKTFTKDISVEQRARVAWMANGGTTKRKRR